MKDSRRLRVMHVLKSSIYSGAENVVITIIKQLSDQFDFIYIASEGPIREILKKEKIPFQLMERFNRSSVCKAADEYVPDIIHAHDFTASVLCASLTGHFRLISHLHYDPPWVKTWNIRTMAYALCRKKISRVLAVSQKMFDGMVFSDIYRDIETEAGNPIDIGRIRRMASDHVSDAAACDLIFVGRLTEQKDPERFIRLAARLKRQGWIDMKAVMLGEGPLYDACKALIEELGLDQQVSLKGFRENPYPYIAAAKILCIPSRWEGFGLAAVEACLLGTPVLTTVTAGSCALFGENAEELCRTDDDFIEKIERLRASSETYHNRREHSLKLAARWDNLERYMDRMTGLYREREL